MFILSNLHKLKKKSADYRHTLSWLTTSHNSLWDICAQKSTIFPMRMVITRLHSRW